MIARYALLSRKLRVFQIMTGLTVAEFDEWAAELTPAHAAATDQRLYRARRQRAPGAGHPFALDPADQLLLVLVWLRQYLTHETLGWLFGVSDSTATRVIARWLPLLEAAGKATMRPQPSPLAPRKTRDALLAEVPELLVLVDSFEQRVQRPQERTEADRWYSGKKKQHTIKSQVSVHEDSGEIMDVAESVRGPTADITLLADSQVATQIPEDMGLGGDLAYQGCAKLHPAGLGATPRKKPRGKERPAEDRAYNRAFARRRIVVEHTIGRLRRWNALTATDRNHRAGHTARVRAVSGLVNRQIRARLAAQVLTPAA